MGRWSQYDEDGHRLPEGMERIGYDSDTGRYYFQDRDGATWQGAEGAEFSEMTKISDGRSVSLQAHDLNEDDVEAAPPTRSDGYQALSTHHARNTILYQPNPYRTLFPFFLIVAVVLLLIWRLIISPLVANPNGGSPCPKTMKTYWIQPGDTCWEIARVHGCSLEGLKEANKEVDCAVLIPGTTVCLPLQNVGASGGGTAHF